MVDTTQDYPIISEPTFASNLSEIMPGRNLPDGDEAARINDMIDAELKVRSLN
jgi:hypothetical protein